MSVEVDQTQSNEIQTAERSLSEPSHVVYGVYEIRIDMNGRSLADLRRACRAALGLEDQVVALINGRPVWDSSYRLRPGERIEFTGPAPGTQMSVKSSTFRPHPPTALPSVACSGPWSKSTRDPKSAPSSRGRFDCP